MNTSSEIGEPVGPPWTMGFLLSPTLLFLTFTASLPVPRTNSFWTLLIASHISSLGIARK